MMYCVCRAAHAANEVARLRWGTQGEIYLNSYEFKQGQRTDQICKDEALAAQTA